MSDCSGQNEHFHIQLLAAANRYDAVILVDRDCIVCTSDHTKSVFADKKEAIPGYQTRYRLLLLNQPRLTGAVKQLNF